MLLGSCLHLNVLRSLWLKLVKNLTYLIKSTKKKNFSLNLKKSTRRSILNTKNPLQWWLLQRKRKKLNLLLLFTEIRPRKKLLLLHRHLLQHRGRVLSREVLLADVWGYTYMGGSRTVDVHVRRLREKLPILESALVTVKQFGYKLADDREAT